MEVHLKIPQSGWLSWKHVPKRFNFRLALQGLNSRLVLEWFNSKVLQNRLRLRFVPKRVNKRFVLKILALNSKLEVVLKKNWC